MPFGPYKDFDDCVAQNQDRENPEAFCAWLHHQITGRWPGENKSIDNTKGGDKGMNWEEKANKFWAENEDITLTREMVKTICPSCAEKMKDLGLTALKISSKQMPPQLLQGLCDKFGEDEGFFTRCMDSTLGDFDPDEQEAFCAWLHHECLGVWPAETANRGKSKEGIELTGIIVSKNNKKKIAYAAVAVPGEVDYDGETLSAEKIEEVAHKWMEDYQNIDIMHTLNNIDAVPVESYLAPVDLEVKMEGKSAILPKGSWILGTKFHDEEIWQGIESGKYKGYSLMGVRRAALKQLLAAAKSGNIDEELRKAGLKKTLLRDLGPDWIAPFVSVVDEPAVPKAKFFALKNKNTSDDNEKGGMIQKIMKGLGLYSTKEGRRFSEATYLQLKKAIEALNALLEEAEKEREKPFFSEQKNKNKEVDIDMSNEELNTMLNEAIKSAIAPLQEEIKAIKESLASINKDKDDAANKDKDDAANKDKDDAANKDKDYETFKKDILNKLEEIEKKVKKSTSASKALKGQDGDGKEDENDDDRDIYGRKKKGGR